MKKDELTALGLTDEQADKVLAINGRDIEKHKKAAEDAKAETATLQQQLSDRDKDLEALKAGAEDAEKVKQQLPDLQTKYNDETAKYQKQIADRCTACGTYLYGSHYEQVGGMGTCLVCGYYGNMPGLTSTGHETE